MIVKSIFSHAFVEGCLATLEAWPYFATASGMLTLGTSTTLLAFAGSSTSAHYALLLFSLVSQTTNNPPPPKLIRTFLWAPGLSAKLFRVIKCTSRGVFF